jgi:Chlorophyll A-B binding protein
MKFPVAALALLLSSAHAFTPTSKTTNVKPAIKSSVADEPSNDKPLFDPFGLYPKDSEERQNGKLQPLEPAPSATGPVKDPMNLYSDKSAIDLVRPMSASVPFLQQPPMLDGSLPGDRGFDPFNFSADSDALQWYRTSEVKHARLAMLAAVGWPLAELLDKKLAYLFDLKPLLVFQDRVPSVLNGGLDRTPAAYWAAALGVAFAIECFGVLKENRALAKGADMAPGDLGFDPLGLAGKTTEERFFKSEAELFNGRLAMLAITSFALQEWWTSNSVVNQFPIFFKPINIALEQMQDAAGNAL